MAWKSPQGSGEPQTGRLVQCRVSPDRFSAQVVFPGLAYTDFGKYSGGRLTPFAVAELFECVYLYVTQHGFIFNSDLFTENFSGFSKLTHIRFSRKAHSITGSTHFGAAFPLLVKTDIVHIGRSSITERYVLCEQETGDELAEANVKSIFVNLKERKPTKFPDWFRDKWEASRTNKQDIPMPRSEPLDVPSDAYRYPVTARVTDGDLNDHVNQNQFINFVICAWSSGVKQRRFPYFNKSPSSYALELYEVDYVQELLVTDSVLVHIWQDELAPWTSHFRITKSGATVAKGRLGFHQEDMVKPKM